MPDFVTIKNITATNIRVGSQTIAGAASAVVDVLDQKTARDLESNSGFYIVTSGSGGSFVITPSDTAPGMDGAAAAGVSALYSRGDHIHPTDTSRAPLASPVFTGDPQAPTPLTADNDTSVATTAFVKAQAYAPIANPVFTGDPQAPTPLTADNDTSVATTAFVKAQAYAPIANPVFTGDPQAPTPLTADNDTSIATTAFVKAQAYAPLANPVFTGDPQAPTPASGDNDTSLATTAFVKAQSYLTTTTAASTYAPINNPVLTGDPQAPTPSAGDNDTSVATTAFVQAAATALIPSGVILMYGAAAAPSGWLLCDGSSQLRASFANLFAAIGVTFGSVDGTHFTLPDFRGRTAIGSGTGDAADATAHALGSKVGTETHGLSTGELPAHDHSPTANGLTGSTTPGVTGGPSTANTGAGTAHGHTQPGGQYFTGGTTPTNPTDRVMAGNSGTGVTGVPFTTSFINTEAAHTHSLSAHTHTSAAHTHSLSSVGSGTAFSVTGPTLTVNYIIKT